MGCVCGKSFDNPSSASMKYPSDASFKTEEINLQTKKDFQVKWEKAFDDGRGSIKDLFPLTLASKDITLLYNFENKIGEGCFGSVRKAKLKSDPSRVYAVKSVPKSKLKGDLKLLKNELEMLRFCEHPNIIQFYEIFQDQKSFHFVLEHCNGGDIVTRLEKEGHFSEEVAKKIIFEVLFAVNYLHTCGIIHRDIKPDNFLFDAKNPDSVIKMIDFGLSRRYKPGVPSTSVVGTPNYVAPELINGKPYDEKIDVWACGIFLYMLFTASFPFKGKGNQEMFKAIRSQDHNQNAGRKLDFVSSEGRAFLNQLLVKSPAKRCSAREALRHPWFDKLNIEIDEKGKAALNKEIMQRLRNFASGSKLVKEVLRLIVMTHDHSPEVINLKNAFMYLDLLNDGIIRADELKKAFQEHEIDISDREIQEIIDSLECRTPNVVTYLEFVTATLPSSFYKKDSILKEVFHRFDGDQDGYIGFDDMLACFNRFGIDIKRREVEKIISTADANKDKKISFPEFRTLMTQDNHLRTNSNP